MPEGKAMIKKLLSDENVKKSGLKIVAAYVSCPKDKSAEHKGFFIVTRSLFLQTGNQFFILEVELSKTFSQKGGKS
jgi:hypothetical protein